VSRLPTGTECCSQPAVGFVKRSLLLNVLWAVGGMGVYHLCQLGVLILLAKFATPEVQGQYFLGLALATPVLLLCGLELRAALVADVDNRFTLGTYGALRVVTMTLAGLILVAAGWWQSRGETRWPYLLMLGGLAAARLLWTQAEFGWGTYQRRERLDWLALTVGLRGLTLLLPFAILLPALGALTTGRAAGGQSAAVAAALAVVLHAAGMAAVWLLFDRPRVFDRRCWELGWCWGDVLRLAWQTLPLGVVALIINLCDSFPRLLFNSDRVADGKTQLGYFGALAYITLAGNLVVVQAATAAANRLSLHYRDNLRAFLRLGALLSAAALFVGLVVVALAVVAGRWILATLYTAEYAAFHREFVLIAAAHALALLTNVFGAAVTQMRLFWVQVPVQVVTLAATILAALWLIPGPTPVRGAAWTAVVRAVVQFVLYAGCVAWGISLRHRLGTNSFPPGRVDQARVPPTSGF